MQRLQFPPHDLVIDEERFRALLAGSLSLMPIEKKRILESSLQVGIMVQGWPCPA